jgi:small conductance mechanosensitive channel
MPPDSVGNSTAVAPGVSLIDQLQAEGLQLLISFATKVVIAAIIILIGFWIAGRLVKVVNRLLVAREVDETIRPFLRSSASFLFKAIVLIIAVSTMGVETTSIVAVLGSMGLAIGLALQGSLGNFAGGILILTLKPIKKGEVIEAQGIAGKVEEISVMNTTVLTFDNKTVFLPNGPLAGGAITNYTRQNTRRVDLKFGIGYQDDVEKARKIILDLANASPYTIKMPEAPIDPFVRVTNLGDSSVDFVVRIWTLNENYFPLYFDMIEGVKREFDAQGVSIPYPQRDIHLFQEKPIA